MDETRELWNKAAAFHGHVCGGLTIGYKAALYAIELLGLTFSPDEELVCIAENDACGCDAIQAILGCSVGKGNLLFHMTGKQAFSFYERKTGQSLRLVLRPSDRKMTRQESLPEPGAMFDVKETKSGPRSSSPTSAKAAEKSQVDQDGKRQKALRGLLPALRPLSGVKKERAGRDAPGLLPRRAVEICCCTVKR